VGHETMDRMLEATEDIATVEHRSRRVEGRRLTARLEPAGN
jgi:translation initiation factor IF-3